MKADLLRNIESSLHKSVDRPWFITSEDVEGCKGCPCCNQFLRVRFERYIDIISDENLLIIDSDAWY